jgi:signal transduction histidine kinase
MAGATVDGVTISTWRATRHLVAGAVLAVATAAVFGVVVLFWGAAIDSLIDGPTGPWYLPPAYVIAVPGGLLALLWCVRRFAEAQRSRFRRTLGVAIATPAGRGRWLVRPWRQLGYHLIAMCLAVPAALSIAVPPAARRLTRADLTLGRVLLGPSRAERLEQRVEALAQSRAEVIEATDAERRRIERDLHDGAQQRLVSLAMNLGMARSAMTDGPDRDRVVAAHDDAVAALSELREFVRGLHPAVLNDRGLDAAVSGVAARAPVPVKVSVDVRPRCSPTIEAIAYFTVSEALTNVAKHARATSAAVTLRRSAGRLRITVTDDGSGGARVDSAGGLNGLAQRAAAVDGTMTVHSPAGGPTTVTVELPCE